MKYYKTEMFGSYAAAMQAFEKAFADGWKIDQENPPDQVGFSYALTLVRDDEPEYKMTRAEILVKARAARSHHNKDKGEQANE